MPQQTLCLTVAPDFILPYGALRMMEYLKTGRVDTLSSQERVVLTLMTGKANTSLTQREAGEPGRHQQSPCTVM